MKKYKKKVVENVITPADDVIPAHVVSEPVIPEDPAVIAPVEYPGCEGTCACGDPNCDGSCGCCNSES